MKARSIARELALLALYQLPQEELFKTQTHHVRELALNAIRVQTQYAQEQLSQAASDIRETLNWAQDAQDDHPDNEDIPYNEPTKPIALKRSDELVERLENVLNAADTVLNAINWPEIAYHSEQEHIQNYVGMVFKSLNKNKAFIETILEKALVDWRLERLQKMDRAMLELATAEMLATRHVDKATVIDEYVELTKRYSDEESYRFINGILSTVSDELTNAPSVVVDEADVSIAEML